MSTSLSFWQRKILEYLRDRAGFVSPTAIASGTIGPPNHSSWASPKCKTLVERGLLERSDRGHYRITKEGVETLNEKP